MNLNIAFHPQKDSQAEHTFQTFDDMVRDCIIDFKENWNNHFPLVDFAYIIVVIHPSQWIPMNPYMIGGVVLLLDGMMWLSLKFFFPILYIRLWRKFIL